MNTTACTDRDCLKTIFVRSGSFVFYGEIYCKGNILTMQKLTKYG